MRVLICDTPSRVVAALDEEKLSASCLKAEDDCQESSDRYLLLMATYNASGAVDTSIPLRPGASLNMGVGADSSRTVAADTLSLLNGAEVDESDILYRRLSSDESVGRSFAREGR